MSLKMGHVESKTRSMGEILEKPCVHFRGYIDLTLVPPVKIPIFIFLLPRLIACASQPDGNMTSFTLHFSHLTLYCNGLLCGRGTPWGITEKNCAGF